MKSTEVQTLGAASRLATTTQIRSVHDQPMCSYAYVISHVILHAELANKLAGIYIYSVST